MQLKRYATLTIGGVPDSVCVSQAELEKLEAEVERLRGISDAAIKCRNVSRGYRAEDATVPLPDVSDVERESYCAELRLKLWALLDESEAAKPKE